MGRRGAVKSCNAVHHDRGECDFRVSACSRPKCPGANNKSSLTFFDSPIVAVDIVARRCRPRTLLRPAAAVSKAAIAVISSQSSILSRSRCPKRIPRWRLVRFLPPRRWPRARRLSTSPAAFPACADYCAAPGTVELATVVPCSLQRAASLTASEP
ncbi:hypothetical protein M011DRAFT_336734 [Sporormia fimetaria CBS 119925]|uniref:Uncharacterized protein n=1 Tax=Sporormia fimetaria CBS 119925 TaxID=1340428 RepID=A0A6A6VGM6_9PLEO|nr:hypothetical protein M011DRAFT_336734 [Sporormia fimetaria CBS 119925]